MSMSEQNYISRQITVYKTDKKLIEFIDKLKPAPTDFYAHIHSFGDKDEEGVKQTSCIGIVLQDYIVFITDYIDCIKCSFCLCRDCGTFHKRNKIGKDGGSRR